MIRIDPSRLRSGTAAAMLSAAMACLVLNHVVGRGMHGIAPPVGLSFWRWTVAAAIALALVGRGLGPKLALFRRHWLLLLVLGTLMVGSTTLFMWALQFTQAMNVSLTNALQPTMTVLLTFVFFRHRLALLQVVGIVLGFVGVLVMVSQGRWQSLAALHFNRGDVVTLVGVLGLAGYAVLLPRLPRDLEPMEAVFGITVAGILAMLPVYAAESLLDRPFPVTPPTVGAVLAMGSIGSVAGNMLWNIGNQALGPNKASIFINLIPVFGMAMAVAFLGETPHAYQLAGLALICAGVWCVLARRLARPDAARAG